MWWVRYVGIPFKSQGRDKKGCDCWGLVRMVYQEHLNLNLPSWSANDWVHSAATAHQRMAEALPHFDKVAEPEPFAVALFRSNQHVFHVGVLIDRDRMLHTTTGKNACIQPWKAHACQLLGFYLPRKEPP